MRTLPWKPALMVLALAGCGAAPPPRNAGDAEAAIRSAEEMGARQVPKASLHLQMAHDAYAKATQLVKDDEPTDARYMFMRSEADAELALALTREAFAWRDLDNIEPLPSESPSDLPPSQPSANQEVMP